MKRVDENERTNADNHCKNQVHIFSASSPFSKTKVVCSSCIHDRMFFIDALNTAIHRVCTRGIAAVSTRKCGISIFIMKYNTLVIVWTCTFSACCRCSVSTVYTWSQLISKTFAAFFDTITAPAFPFIEPVSCG